VEKKRSKAKYSIEASRQTLLADLKKKCKGTTVTKTIKFTNNDVPKYLEFLSEFEEKSRKISLMVK